MCQVVKTVIQGKEGFLGRAAKVEGDSRDCAREGRARRICMPSSCLPEMGSKVWAWGKHCAVVRGVGLYVVVDPGSGLIKGIRARQMLRGWEEGRSSKLLEAIAWSA